MPEDYSNSPQGHSADPSPGRPPQAEMLRPRHGGDDTEIELWRGAFSPRAMFGAWSLSALVTVGLFVLGVWQWERMNGNYWGILLLAILLLWIYQFAALLYRRLDRQYLLTNQRLVHEHGILRRVTDRIEVIDIDDVSFEQGIVERMFGVGNVRIISSDRSHPEFRIRGIDDVARVSEQIDRARRDERVRRGLHIASI